MTINLNPGSSHPEVEERSKKIEAVKQRIRNGLTPRSRKIFIWAGATAIIIAGCVFAGNIFKKQAASEPVPVMTVSVTKAKMQPIKRHLSVTGSISAWDPLSIGAEVNGLRIDKIYVDEGQHVKKGQILLTLNAAVLKAQLEQEKARLMAAHANWKKSVQPNRVEDINGLRAYLSQARATVAQEEANLVRARTNHANAENNAKRYSYLRKEGAVSLMEADNTITNAKAAEADVVGAKNRVEAARFAVKQAEEKLSMAVSGGRQEDIQTAKASVAETQARVQQLEAEIAQTVVRAPDDGWIVKRDAHIGEITTTQKVLFGMVRNNKLELKAQVPEVDLLRIHPGQKVEISSGAQGGIHFPGVVREITPFVDQATREGTIRIDVPAGGTVLPGMFFHGDIELGEATVLTLPSKSILNRDDQSFVFTLVGNKVERTPVMIGERTGGLVEIQSGVKPDQQIVLSGGSFLKDGDVVRVSSQE